MTKQADFKRRVRARMAKTGESYIAARARLVAVEHGGRLGPPRTALHVTNGDSTVPELRATGLAGRILPWRDVLHEGPVPALPDDELRRLRAAFLHERQAEDIGAEEAFASRDALLAENRDGDYVLWFEADLYDQLQIVQILARLARMQTTPERITLICIGEHPGIAHFGGLGELTADQLRRLPETAATQVDARALDYARRAWDAFTAPDPAGIAAIVAAPSQELRFVAEAFDRLGREYPSTRDGLSLTERRILAAIADTEATAGAAFVRASARETRPFLGDTWCYDRMTRLLHVSTPLLEADAQPAGITRQTRLKLSAAGRRVLDGQADNVALNGVDYWIGGVHLSGRTVPWRWHEGTESLVRQGEGRSAAGAPRT